MIELKRHQLSKIDEDKILISGLPKEIEDSITFRFKFKVGNKHYDTYVHDKWHNGIVVKKY